MARNIKDLEKELLELPRQERARLAHELIVSLDEEEAMMSPDEWQAAWLEEVKLRQKEIENGEVDLSTHEEVMFSLKSALRK